MIILAETANLLMTNINADLSLMGYLLYIKCNTEFS